MLRALSDFVYEKKRDALIPIAEAAANKAAGIMPAETDPKWANRWNRIFHDTMNRLAKERLR